MARTKHTFEIKTPAMSSMDRSARKILNGASTGELINGDLERLERGKKKKKGNEPVLQISFINIGKHGKKACICSYS